MLVSTGKAGNILGVTSQTVRRWIEEGKLPAIRVGAHYRVSLADIEKATRSSITRGSHD